VTGATFIGIDGCRGGWIAVTLADDGAGTWRILPRIADAASLAGARVMIDIPIGLPEHGRRSCDIAARAMLGAARSRVFLDARRPLLEFRAADDYAAANRWGKEHGAGCSRQLWNILDKIAEVDCMMTPALQDHIRESHPELVFMRLGGGGVLAGKKTRAGRDARRAILRAAGLGALDQWLGASAGKAKADDLLDAAALALAARDPRRVRCDPATDARGLRMDIWS
jgi:predicted RNase H-like nuclease